MHLSNFRLASTEPPAMAATSASFINQVCRDWELCGLPAVGLPLANSLSSKRTMLDCIEYLLQPDNTNPPLQQLF